jgi:hypothetical protein
MLAFRTESRVISFSRSPSNLAISAPRVTFKLTVAKYGQELWRFAFWLSRFVDNCLGPRVGSMLPCVLRRSSSTIARRCHSQVRICSRCDSGHIYRGSCTPSCGREARCRASARAQKIRRAARRYAVRQRLAGSRHQLRQSRVCAVDNRHVDDRHIPITS